jgi:hypothetical protein
MVVGWNTILCSSCNARKTKNKKRKCVSTIPLILVPKEGRWVFKKGDSALHFQKYDFQHPTLKN